MNTVTVQEVSTSLLDRLNDIDRDTIQHGRTHVGTLWLLERHGMWKKGREIVAAYPAITKPAAGGRGVTAGFSEIARLTSRDREALAKWVALYLAHPDEAHFLAWATDHAQIVLKHWENRMLGGPSIPVSTPLPPAGQYSVILADPPWRYEVSRLLDNHYPTMDVQGICALGESMPMADQAVLFLWTTAPQVQEALQVIAAWKFSYRTHAIWDKEMIGLGFWFRGQHECLFVATRGQFSTPPESMRISSVIRSRRTTHSKKPDSVYEYLEAAYPDHPKLELFARAQRPGWTAWGNEVS